MVTSSTSRANAPMEYVELMAPHISDFCSFVCLCPWRRDSKPPDGVFAVTAADETATLSPAALLRIERRVDIVLIPVTFETPEEEKVLRSVLPSLCEIEGLCILLMHLIPHYSQMKRKDLSTLVLRTNEMAAIGVDDVILNPSRDPATLRRTINVTAAERKVICQRMRRMLDYSGEEDIDPDELMKIADRRSALLWESIPKALMPSFPAVDPHLTDKGNVVGNYRFVKRYATKKGTVVQAVDMRDTKSVYAIKVIDKEMINDPGELECIYREFRFTNTILEHPNVIHCKCMLHSANRVYMVAEDAGNAHLAQILAARPRHHLSEKEALQWWTQMAQGLAFCHAQDVAHRRISLEHTVVADLGNGEYKVKILDFHDAMVVKTAVGNRACGTIPCMSPEMAMGQQYAPIETDIWSAGVVLLEAAGGLGSLVGVAAIQENAPIHVAGQQTISFFRQEKSHEKALAWVDKCGSKTIISMLKKMLVPDPTERTSIATVLSAYGRKSTHAASSPEGQKGAM